MPRLQRLVEIAIVATIAAIVAVVLATPSLRSDATRLGEQNTDTMQRPSVAQMQTLLTDSMNTGGTKRLREVSLHDSTLVVDYQAKALPTPTATRQAAIADAGTVLRTAAIAGVTPDRIVTKATLPGSTRPAVTAVFPGDVLGTVDPRSVTTSDVVASAAILRVSPQVATRG